MRRSRFPAARFDFQLHGQDLGDQSKFTEQVAVLLTHAEVSRRGSYERVSGSYQLPRKGRVKGLVLPASKPKGSANGAATAKSLASDQLYHDQSPAHFVIGYGATRRVESAKQLDASLRKRRDLRYQRVG